MTLLDYERSNISGAITVRRRLDLLREYLGTEDGRKRARRSPTLRA